MTWHATVERMRAVLSSEDEAALRTLWTAFCADVRSGAVERPYHLAMLIGEIEAYARAKGGPVALLDHGCGGGMTLMFLAALGYTDVFGVDVGGDRTPQNRWARVALGYEDDRFVIYDGSRLPLADASIDIVFSQQVLEHVAPKVFASYYEEEARVLKEGGLAIHQVPHRLVPYESHLRLWGWHMLPPMLRDPVLKKRGIEWPSHLHLRWPSAHKRMAAAIIGPTADHRHAPAVDDVARLLRRPDRPAPARRPHLRPAARWRPCRARCRLVRDARDQKRAPARLNGRKPRRLLKFTP